MCSEANPVRVYTNQYDEFLELIYKEFPDGLSDHERSCLALGLLEGVLKVGTSIEALGYHASNALNGAISISINSLKADQESYWEFVLRDQENSGVYLQGEASDYFLAAICNYVKSNPL